MHIRLLLAVVLAFVSAAANAQPSKADGTWLKQGLDAYERVNRIRSGSQEDMTDSLFLEAFVHGMLAVHRQNNMGTLVLLSSVNAADVASGKKKLSPVDEARLRTAFHFTPLLQLPDNLTTEQVFAIIRKYLETNPEKWGTAAPQLITDALKSAFPGR